MLFRTGPWSKEHHRADWQQEVERELMKGGPVCQHAAATIRNKGIRIGFSPQRTGAKWTLSGHIKLATKGYSMDTSPSNAPMLAKVVHEVQHLQDGFLMALSVEGEVRGWAAEYWAREELNAPLRRNRSLWREVALTPENPTNADLKKAKAAIRQMTVWHSYLIWILPLRPLCGLVR